MNQRIHTTCPYCGVGCGVIAEVSAAGAVSVQGDLHHPANFGRLCSKGAALAETLSLDGRLLHPQVDGQRSSWERALQTVAQRFSETIARHGPEAVAFYVSGQLLTEDYYVANKLMKGYIGTANIDTNSRLCMSSAVAAYKRAFGSDTVPGCYEDLELAELIVLTGSNTAWCHPVLFQRIKKAKENRPQLKVVVIDPRRTATCEIADLHLPLKPGTDVALFNGLLAFLANNACLDEDYIERHTEGFAEALRQAQSDSNACDLAAIASVCGLEAAALAQFFSWFAATAKTVTLYSQGINQSSSGTDKCNAIINCHLATGRIGKAGTGPFSITGQPNAMGGREVGGLANMLAAHMDFQPEHTEKVQRFWNSPRIAEKPGLKAVDLFREVGDGKIKALWIMATNPAVSLPDADFVRNALRQCEFVAISDCVADTDSNRYADVLLPALTWGEKNGTVTNSERRISRQRAFLPPPGEARADWWIISQVAAYMGYGAAFGYRSAAEIFREHAALTAFENDGGRDLDIGYYSALSDHDYEQWLPAQWPVNAQGVESRRMFGDGRFFTASGKANFIAVAVRPPIHAPDLQYPLVLNTGRTRDQWHTMTRTGKAARLMNHSAEPYVEIHPDDASRYGLCAGSIARLDSRWGHMLARVNITEGQRRGSIFAPMHWNDCFAAQACAGRLVNPVVDRLSGQPESKHTPVSIAPFNAAWHGFILSRVELHGADAAANPADYWAKAPGRNFFRYILAGTVEPADIHAWSFAQIGGAGEWLEFHDRAQGRYRAARIADGQLRAVLFYALTPELPAYEWLGQLFDKTRLHDSDRLGVLAGKPPQGSQDAGKTVCACFGVGEKTIKDAIVTQGLSSVEEIGKCLQAGSNCGSCIAEIKQLLDAHKSPQFDNARISA